MARLFFMIVAVSLLNACLPAETTWYEDRCLRLGFDRGNDDFNNCIERDRQWIEENNRRVRGEGGA